MSTTLSNKLAALSLALAINSVIMGSVALMFSARLPEVRTFDVAAVTSQVDSNVA